LVTFVSIDIFIVLPAQAPRTLAFCLYLPGKFMVGSARYIGGTDVSNDLLRRRDSQTSIGDGGGHARPALCALTMTSPAAAQKRAPKDGGATG